VGNLTTFLQRGFAQSCPRGWSCSAEQPVVSEETGRRLGYLPRADVLLTRRDGTARLWIEFEVSRADPVANHAKFATANLFEPRPATDTFVSMVSAHVGRGRHNLAASAVYLMRAVGMNAFQTLLLPGLRGDEVKTLNHRPLEDLVARPPIEIGPEVERAFSVAKGVISTGRHRIHFASNLFEVMLNVVQWNDETATAAGSALWGTRTVTFFVHDRVTGLFAPSKYCAFVPVVMRRARSAAHVEMDMSTYVQLDESETRFDGAVARDHLQRRLGMSVLRVADAAQADGEAFWAWHATRHRHLRLHPKGPHLIQAPSWWV
jgi:hypothetical protein